MRIIILFLLLPALLALATPTSYDEVRESQRRDIAKIIYTSSTEEERTAHFPNGIQDVHMQVCLLGLQNFPDTAAFISNTKQDVDENYLNLLQNASKAEMHKLNNNTVINYSTSGNNTTIDIFQSGFEPQAFNTKNGIIISSKQSAARMREFLDFDDARGSKFTFRSPVLTVVKGNKIDSYTLDRSGKPKYLSTTTFNSKGNITNSRIAAREQVTMGYTTDISNQMEGIFQGFPEMTALERQIYLNLITHCQLANEDLSKTAIKIFKKLEDSSAWFPERATAEQAE